MSENEQITKRNNKIKMENMQEENLRLIQCLANVDFGWDDDDDFEDDWDRWEENNLDWVEHTPDSSDQHEGE